MKSIDFTGKGELINRLASQVGGKQKAISILQKRGHLMADGKTFTQEGMKRNSMSAAERAIDRTAKRLKKSPEDLEFDRFSNTAKRVYKI
jgi:hypothetical protein